MSLTNEIERLSKVHSSAGVLSLYISVDPTISYRRGHEIAAAKSALREVERNLKDLGRRSDFARERDKALEFLEREWAPESRAMAIFSSKAAGLWEAIPLNVRLPTQATFDARPKIAPLAQVADENERYCAVVVSKEDARLLIISMGEVEAESAISDSVPGRHDQGGWSQARYQRHRGFHVREHLKRALDELENHLASWPFRKLIVAGPVEVTTEFVELLPEPLKERLIGVVPCSLKAGRDEVMTALTPAIQAHERSEEEALLLQISESADAGGRGVLGLEATLRAISDGRVQELAVADGISASGRECANCGHLDANSIPACPRCKMELVQTEDIIERATERVYAQGGRVEVMFGNARESLVARGGVGALLRY
jgi:peptide chain release factor subunit 1